MPLSTIRYLFIVLFCVPVISNAQTVHVLTNSPSLEVNTYDVLPDKHYSFDQVLTDTRLHFAADDSANADYYWIKMIVDNPYPNDEHYRLSLSLPLNYTLYYADKISIAGPAEPYKKPIPLILKATTKNVLYVKIDTRDSDLIKPTIILEKEISFDGRDKMLSLSWLICIIVLISFSCYNLFIYFQLKDDIYLYYLLMQIGAIIYITAFKHFITLLLPFGIYNIKLNADGSMYYYSLNAFFLHIGGVIIFSGIIQLTRSYLRTKELLPGYDRLLRYILGGYILFGLIPAVITITGIYYLDDQVLLYDNVFVVLICSTVVITSLIAYRHKIRAAGYFLLANLIPIAAAAATAVYFIIHSKPYYTDNHSFLPEIGIISQILTFAVSLVARIRVVNEELQQKELEVGKLAADIALTEYKHMLIEQQNEHIISTIQQEKDKNELLQQKLEANQRELVGNSLYIHQKNKLLADLKDQIQDIDELYPHVKHPGLKSIKTSLKDNQYLDAEWDKFKLHFEQVHPDFFKDLRAQHPSLTQNELRLYAYFHIHLSTKEIAVLLNIAPASVRQAKARLNKKITKDITRS